MKPIFTVLLKYINELNANPNFLFLGIKPHLSSKLPKLDSPNMDLLDNITLMASQEQLVLIDEIIQRFKKQNHSLVAKLLEIVKIDDLMRSRPFLFLYYIFQLIKKDFTDTSKN